MNFPDKYDTQRDIWLRPGTFDEWIFDQIEKDYCLNEMIFNSNDIAIDIGAHIGCFTKRVIELGIGYVYLYEPHPDNMPLCYKNLNKYSNRVIFCEKAVWNKSNETLFFNGLGKNTGNNTAFSGGTIPIQTISFDDEIQKATDNFKKRIKILKIDAEGAEWPILLNSKYLNLIDILVGEIHDFGINGINIPDSLKPLGYSKFTTSEFQTFIISQGFSMRITQDSGSYYKSFKAINLNYKI